MNLIPLASLSHDSSWLLLGNALRGVFLVDAWIAMNNVEFSLRYSFAARYYLYHNPLRFMVLSLVALVLFTAVMLEAVEHSEYLWDSIWNIAVSITTIGYGDIVPVTDPGRLLVVVASNFGVLFLSFITSAIQAQQEFSEKDQEAYDSLLQV